MSFKAKYNNEIVAELRKNLEISNSSNTPKIEKVVLNMGIGSYIRNGGKDFSSLVNDLGLIAGQKPVVRYAKKSVSNFKLRAGMPVGLSVTLRGDKMYNFLEKLVKVVLPRVRDFRGISKRSFDKSGNYNFGIKEHTIFPEVPQNDVVKTHGLQITLTTNSETEGTKALMDAFGFPFAK